MSANDWKREMDAMLANVEQQVSFALNNINRLGRLFNEEFKAYFFRTLNDRVISTYTKIEIRLETCHGANGTTRNQPNDCRLEIENMDCRIASRSNEPVIDIVDSSDDEEEKPSFDLNEMSVTMSVTMSESLESNEYNQNDGGATDASHTGSVGASERENNSHRSIQRTTVQMLPRVQSLGANAVDKGVRTVQSKEIGTLTKRASDYNGLCIGSTIIRCHQSDKITNQIRANQTYEVGGRFDVPNGREKEKDIQSTEPKIDEDVPVVLVELNRMVNASIANIAGVGSNEATKKNHDISDDRGQNDGNSSGIGKKTTFNPIGKRPIISKSEPIQKSNGDKPMKKFRCTVCEYSSNQKGHLKIHMRTHTGEKPHRCDRCGRRFTRAEHLRKHAVTHTDVFPFHCKGCFRGFSQKAAKEAHDKVCQARRYECHLCKKFVSFGKNGLKMHMRSHTGEQPFRCEICLKRFTQKGHLKNHLNNIHGKIH